MMAIIAHFVHTPRCSRERLVGHDLGDGKLVVRRLGVRPAYRRGALSRRGGVSYTRSVRLFFSACSAKRNQACAMSIRPILIAGSELWSARSRHFAAFCW